MKLHIYFHVAQLFLFFRARAGTVVGISCNISCLLGILLMPFMPTTARTLLTQLGTSLTSVGRVNPTYVDFYYFLFAFFLFL